MPIFTICQKIGGYKRCFFLSVRRKTNNRLTLFRKCFICGKDIVTTADTPFIRQIANVNGKKQATVYFCSESCKRKSYKHLFDVKADKRRREREAKREKKKKNRRYYFSHAEEIKAKKRSEYSKNREKYLLDQKYNRQKRKINEGECFFFFFTKLKTSAAFPMLLYMDLTKASKERSTPCQPMCQS